MIGEDVAAQAFLVRFALVGARGKKGVDVRRGAGLAVQESRGLGDLRGLCELLVLGDEFSPDFPAANFKAVADFKLDLV